MKYSVHFFILLFCAINVIHASQPDTQESTTQLSDSIVANSDQTTNLGRIWMAPLTSFLGDHSSGSGSFIAVDVESADDLKKLESGRERKIQEQRQEIAKLQEHLEKAQGDAKKERKELVSLRLAADHQKDVKAGWERVVQDQRQVLQQQKNEMRRNKLRLHAFKIGSNKLRHRQKIDARWHSVLMLAKLKQAKDERAKMVKQMGVVKFEASLKEGRLIEIIEEHKNSFRDQFKKLCDELFERKRVLEHFYNVADEYATQLKDKEIDLEKASKVLAEKDEELALAIKARHDVQNKYDELATAVRDTHAQDEAFVIGIQKDMKLYLPAENQAAVVKVNA